MIFRFLPSVCCSVLLFLSPVFSQETKRKWTPPPVDEIEELIEGGQRGAAGKLIRSKFGSKTLRSGRHWIAGTRVLWIAEAEEPVSVVEKGGEVIADLAALDDSGLQAAVVEVGNQRILTYEMVKGGAAFQSATLKIEFYPYPSESSYHDGIPRGSITTHSFGGSKIFPGTTRELQFYLPAQHRPGRELALIVFQDGLRHAQTDSAGGLRAPVVLDNLIAAGEIPVCGGIFINPGSLKDQPPGSKPRNRSLEYDSLGDAYVRL